MGFPLFIREHCLLCIHTKMATLLGLICYLSQQEAVMDMNIFVPHIDRGVYMSARHVLSDLDLIFTVLAVKFMSSFH